MSWKLFLVFRELKFNAVHGGEVLNDVISFPKVCSKNCLLKNKVNILSWHVKSDEIKL